MKNAFNLYVEKEVSNALFWTELHSYMDSRSSFMPGLYHETKNVKEVNRFVIDVDSCIDRLYGGFDVDWKCGGDWIPMHNMIANLRRCAQMHNMQFVFMFNGTMPDMLQEREWADVQLNTRKNIFKIFQDPKCKEYRSWSTPPFLAEMLKFEISYCNQKDWENLVDTSGANRPKNQMKHKAFQQFTTVEDHQKEILRFCYQNKCRGLITSDYGLIALLAFERFSLQHSDNFNQLRVFVGRNMRFSDNFGINSWEVDLDVLLKSIGLNENQFGCFTILVGLSSYVPDSFLTKFYEALIDKPNLVINSLVRTSLLLPLVLH